MSQSLMVYPNSNEFLHMAPTMLDENVAKLINAEPLESYLASASTSPVQDYIYHPQQEQSNQRQHQLFPTAAHVPTVVSHSAPNSPPYAVVKTEEVQPNPVDYLLFDLPEHILPSQQRTFANVSLMQQHQQHQQQQQHHAQQLRMQHRQQQFQQQIMYDTPNHSTVTSSMMSTMVSAASSNSLFAPTAIATSAPFFNATTPLAQDDAFQRRNYVAPAAHPAAPKRKRDDNESDEPSSPSSTTPALSKIKTTRSTKVLKPSSSPSPVASYPPVNELTGSDSKSRKKAVAIKKAISESRESSEQPENAESSVTYPSRVPGSAGNVTHPRRAAQNRAAQRTFRNRRKAYIKELEQKVGEIDSTRELMDAVQAENQEVWRRLQILEALASRNGLQLPAFAPLTSIAATTNLSAGITSISVVAGNDYGLAMDNSEMMMMNHLGSSDDE
ncbi:MAG: hypothetical protein J3Q66DRAFT_354731 [Benniella sp.]|nr:MAG: hypothetical protein J3Q66DRAFT_354731 [Benniella sp.]